MNESAVQERHCSNCGSALQGPHCSQCGQHTMERPGSLRPFIRFTDDNRVVSSLSAATTGRSIDIELLEEHGVPIDVFQERFRTAVHQSLPQFMIGSFLLSPLALALFNPRRPALVPVVFALHWTGFFMLIIALARVLPLRPGSNLIENVASLVAFVHLMLSLRHACSHARIRVVLSGLGLFVLFNAILILWVLAVGEYAFRHAI